MLNFQFLSAQDIFKFRFQCFYLTDWLFGSVIFLNFQVFDSSPTFLLLLVYNITAIYIIVAREHTLYESNLLNVLKLVLWPNMENVPCVIEKMSILLSLGGMFYNYQ